MQVNINERLEEAILKVAGDTGQSAEEFVNGLLEYSFDNGLAVLQMARVEELLTREVLPRLLNLNVQQLATRHQVKQLHADISDGPERSIAVSKNADEVAYLAVFGEE